MRTRISQRRNKRSSAVTWGAAALAVALLLVLVRLVAPGVFLAGAAPLFAGGDALAAATGGFFSSFGDAQALATKNRALQEENAALVLKNETLRQQVSDLMGLIGTTTALQVVQGVPASVVVRPPTAPYDTLVVALVSRDGVVSGMEAYGAAGTPLGVVEAVAGSYARIRLFTSAGITTDAWAGVSHVPVTLKGRGGGAFGAGVAQGSGIAVGDLIYLPSPNGAAPVGRVAHIKGAASDPVAVLAIAPVVNPFSITWVTLSATPTFPEPPRAEPLATSTTASP